MSASLFNFLRLFIPLRLTLMNVRKGVRRSYAFSAREVVTEMVLCDQIFDLDSKKNFWETHEFMVKWTAKS